MDGLLTAFKRARARILYASLEMADRAEEIFGFNYRSNLNKFQLPIGLDKEVRGEQQASNMAICTISILNLFHNSETVLTHTAFNFGS